jgi:hypothetical protein
VCVVFQSPSYDIPISPLSGWRRPKVPPMAAITDRHPRGWRCRARSSHTLGAGGRSGTAGAPCHADQKHLDVITRSILNHVKIICAPPLKIETALPRELSSANPQKPDTLVSKWTDS